MAYADGAYESTVNGSVQTLAVGVRTLLAIDDTTLSQSTPPFSARRWNKSTSSIRGMFQGELLNLRYASVIAPVAPLISFTPFSLHWEFDISAGGTGTNIIEDWFDYSSTLGVTLLSAAGRKRSAAQPVYVGATFIANGCKVYVTAVGAGCTLTSSALLISQVGAA